MSNYTFEIPTPDGETIEATSSSNTEHDALRDVLAEATVAYIVEGQRYLAHAGQHRLATLYRDDKAVNGEPRYRATFLCHPDGQPMGTAELLIPVPSD